MNDGGEGVRPLVGAGQSPASISSSGTPLVGVPELLPYGAWVLLLRMAFPCSLLSPPLTHPTS